MMRLQTKLKKMKRINKVLIELYKDKGQLLVLSVMCCVSYLLQLLLPSDLNVNQAAGAMLAIAAIGVGVSMYNGSKNRKAAAKAAGKAKAEKDKQIALLNVEKQRYESFKFENPYENIQTEFENTSEDLTVNQEQAQFEAEQGAQNRANIMQGMQGAAGGSGVASLAQAMANQGQLAARQASASIGQQESRNQQMKAQGAADVQRQEAAAGVKIASGDELVARQEADRRATLLGMQAQMAGGAAEAATSANQMQVQTDIDSRNATTGAIVSGASSVAGSMGSARKEGGGDAPAGTTVQTNAQGNEVSVMPGYDANGNPI